MAVDPIVTILLDLYGVLLTEKERDALDLYYNEDLSLKEIADNEAIARRERRERGAGENERDTITRQGVRDTIKRAEAKLYDWEDKLHLADKADARSEALDRICEQARLISDCNINHGCLRDINDAVSEIVAITGSLRE